ncbi:MAG: AgmX/PglI C-terminal domain-containing protein [Proteobacteria bacterium]|nr:AgmX/PglI C-terminal domain-containing protein [Pseudomonadota bacterium]
MPRKPTLSPKLFLRIMWGDSSLGEISRSFQAVRSITIGRGLTCDVRSMAWPLLDDMTLFERESGKLMLNQSISWDGVFGDGSDLTILDARDRRKKPLEIKSGTFATLKAENITIAFRVGLNRPNAMGGASRASAFRGSILGLIAATSFERNALAVSIVTSLLLFGSIAAGLLRRPIWRPEAESDIPDSFRIPFVSPSHLATGPDVLQDRLDRYRVLDSVSGFYQDLSVVMTQPKLLPPAHRLFDETVRSYIDFSSEREGRIAQFEASTARLANEIASRGGFVVSVPAVRGESLDGSMQRMLDKINTISASSAELTSIRGLTASNFKADATYDYGNAGGKSGHDSFADFTKRLGDGFRQVLPDEQQQAAEAKSHAVEALAAQIALFGKEHLKSGVQNCCETVIGVKPGATPVTYIPMPRFLDSDLKLSSLKSSQWGAPEALKMPVRIIEPLIGAIDANAVESAIASGKFQLQLCFELALRRNQAAKGNMEWSWQIDSKGSISRLALLSSTLKDEELVRCVRMRIAGWKFPKAKGGSVEIRYPFEFVRDRG